MIQVCLDTATLIEDDLSESAQDYWSIPIPCGDDQCFLFALVARLLDGRWRWQARLKVQSLAKDKLRKAAAQGANQKPHRFEVRSLVAGPDDVLTTRLPTSEETKVLEDSA